MKYLALLPSALVGCALCIPNFAGPPAASGPDRERWLPSVTLLDEQNQPVNLAEIWVAKPLVIVYLSGFVNGTLGRDDLRQINDYQGAYPKLKARDVEVVMVVPGSTDLKEFLRSVRESIYAPTSEYPSFRILSDRQFVAARAFEISVRPGSTIVEAPYPTTVIATGGRVFQKYPSLNLADRPAAVDIYEILQKGRK